MKVNHIRQNVFPVLAALIWGTAFVAQSVAADHVGPHLHAARARCLCVLLVLCLVFRCLRRRDFQEEAQARPVPGGIWPSAVSAAAWS